MSFLVGGGLALPPQRSWCGTDFGRERGGSVKRSSTGGSLQEGTSQWFGTCPCAPAAELIWRQSLWRSLSLYRDSTHKIRKINNCNLCAQAPTYWSSPALERSQNFSWQNKETVTVMLVNSEDPQVCGSKLQRVSILGDGCWLPFLCFSLQGSDGTRSQCWENRDLRSQQTCTLVHQAYPEWTAKNQTL